MFGGLLKCYENMKKAYNNSQNNNYKDYVEKLYKKFYVDYICDYSITTKNSESEIILEYIKLGANKKDSVLYKEYSNLLKFVSKIDDLEITLDNRLLDNQDYDFFHYQQSYELAKCKYGTFYLTSCGELKCDYFDDKGNWVDNAIDTIQNNYVKNNEEYNKAIENGNLILDYNNWFSIYFIDNNNNSLQSFDYLENVYGSISEGLSGLLDIITDDEFIKDTLKELGVE